MNLCMRKEYAPMLPSCIDTDADLTRVRFFVRHGFSDGIFVQLFDNPGIARTRADLFLNLELKYNKAECSSVPATIRYQNRY